MGRRSVEVPPVLFDVFAVVALGAGETEHALLENRVLPVPERKAETPGLACVGEGGHPVFVPAEGATSRVVVRKEGPGVTVGAVVFADRSPGSFGDVRSPVPPALGAVVGLCDAFVFGPTRDMRHGLIVVDSTRDENGTGKTFG